MDTIVTPVTVITLDSTRIVHNVKADFTARFFPPVVRLVQYDQSLPVIAVSLMQNGQTYTLPSGAAANIRVHKPDATYVYNPALGCDSTRKIVYFEVTQAMAAANGDGLAIVEIVVNGDIAGTSLITLHFEENPVPEDAIESSDEWETIYELGERIIASTVTPVSTAAGMIDHNVVYLYTGTESGWNQGHMYYYNGTTWVDAGIASTDATLSIQNMAADAKATGDAIAAVRGDVDELQTDVEELQTDVSTVKDGLNNALENGTTRFDPDDFYNRGLDNSGNFNSQQYRVSSRAITTAPNDCTLTPASGFRFYIYIYNESDAISKYGWFTTTYNLSAGTRYKLLIARVTENTSESANIEEFINSILVGTYVSALGDVVENLKTESALTDWVADNVLTDRISVLDAFPQTSNYAFVIRSGKVTLTVTTNYKYRVGSVTQGHKYHIKTTTGNTAYGYAFTDSEDNYLTSDNVHSATDQVELDVIAPVGASKLYVNALTARSSEIWEWEKPKEQFKFELPDYYDSYLEAKLDTIREKERDYGFNGATYAFITDFHYYANKLNSIPLLERIRQKTNAVHLIYGGDSVRALGTESYLLSDNYEVASLLSGVYDTDYSYIFGNHDYTIATGGSWGQDMVSIPIAEVHSIYKKGFSTPIKRNYHYYDDEIDEIRHVFIDYTQAGYPWFLEWFRDDALNIPAGWSVAFYCHTPFVANAVEAPSRYMTYLADWICALANKRAYTQTITSTVGGTTYNTEINVDYTASTVTVIYAACGHIHKDTLSVVDGVTFFSTTCDAMYQDDGYGRTAGTTDEQAFDVITINKTSKTVNLIRIGAGENRSFTY